MPFSDPDWEYFALLVRQLQALRTSVLAAQSSGALPGYPYVALLGQIDAVSNQLAAYGKSHL